MPASMPNWLMCMPRNILPENLHFDKDLKIKLAHFLTALEFKTGAVATGAVSVVDYLAPEVQGSCLCGVELLAAHLLS